MLSSQVAYSDECFLTSCRENPVFEREEIFHFHKMRALIGGEEDVLDLFFEKSEQLVKVIELKNKAALENEKRLRLKKLDLNLFYVRSANFMELDVHQVTFNEADMHEVDFYRSHIYQTTFIKSKLDSVDFTESRIVLSKFQDSSLAESDFSHADIKFTSYKEAELFFSSFLHATLFGVSFMNANLISADMHGIVCKGVNFKGATLIGVDFTSADLRQSNIQEALDLKGAKYDIRTQFPDGFDAEAAQKRGMILVGPLKLEEI
jgi:uncharacterized protein YjbI with pentapeptide repeats